MICITGNNGMRTGRSAARGARRQPMWLTTISTQTMIEPYCATPCK